MDSELVLEKKRVFLAQNREDELVVEFQPVQEVRFAHDGVFDFSSEKYPFQEVVEFDAVHVSDNEDVDDLVRRFRKEVADFAGNGDESYGFLAFEELFYRPDRVVGLHEHVQQLVENDAILVYNVKFLFVMFSGFANPEFLQIDQFPSDGVDLLPEVAAEFADKKAGFPVTSGMFDEEFFEQLGAAVRSEEFGKTGHIDPYNMSIYRFPK